MLFHDSKDESAIGLMLVGFAMVVMAAFLGNVTANVQPKAPVEGSRTDVSSLYLQEKVPKESTSPNTSPYPQPQPERK